MGIKIHAKTLRENGIPELERQVEEFRKELAAIRVQKVTKSNSNKLSQSYHVRKNIARCLRVIREKKYEELKIKYEGKKIKPIELRPKLTRAKRRELTHFEKTRKLLKVKKRLIAFPRRLYAIKA